MNTDKYDFDYDSYLQAQHLSQQQPAAPEPPASEIQRYVNKVCFELAFNDPASIATEILPYCVWDGAGRVLRVEGRVLQSYLRDLAKERPELLKPKHRPAEAA